MLHKKKSIEVELRSIIEDGNHAEDILNYCTSKGVLLSEENRILIDYSTFLEGVRDRKKDIRVRSTNGKIEIIVKTGGFADASREEAGIIINSTSLKPALTVMALLGFKKGIAALRHILRFQVGELEIALQEVQMYQNPKEVHSRFIEIEKMTDENGRKAAERKIQNCFDQLGLHVLTSEEWYAYVEELNRSANGIFDYDNADWEAIEILNR